MKQLKIDFKNMWGGFFKHDNIITNTLSLEYTVTVDENNPDIIVCQSSPSDHQSPSAASLTDGMKGRAKITVVATSLFRPASLTTIEMCESHYGLCM